MLTTTAQVIRSFGDETVLEAAELPLDAVPKPGAVRIAVAAASINPVDLTTRAGRNIPVDAARFPMVLGWDLAGVVTAVGDGVDAAVGDRVAAMTFQPLDQKGTHRAVIDLDADLLAPVPASLDLHVAATVPLAGMTADQVVDRTGVRAGDLLLVNAPLGAVGRFVVQLAAARGVRVAGVVSAGRDEDARALGVSTVLSRDAVADGLLGALGGPADAAVDLVGGPAAHAALAAVRDGGAYVTTVPPYIDGRGAFEPVRGVDLHVLTVHPDRDRLDALLAPVADGRLTSPIEREQPSTSAADAHRLQAAGGLRGKLVLIP